MSAFIFMKKLTLMSSDSLIQPSEKIADGGLFLFRWHTNIKFTEFRDPVALMPLRHIINIL
ncbi:hypothetical protein A1D23_05525 [Chelonobacter oris]|nr:hypothetical protein [Chelonobacter oris]